MTTTQIFIEAGGRVGSTFRNEAAFRRAIANGSAVITKSAAGVWFSVTVGEDDAITYHALPKKPEGL